MNTAKQSKNGMPNAHLHDLFVAELRDMLGGEKQLLKGLAKLAKSAQSKNLQKAFMDHISETETHIDRLKQVLQSLDLAPRGKKCKALEGLLKEADEIIEEFEGDEASDAALIAAAQKVEHYEIATYGCLVTYAKLMGHDKQAAILAETLEEEKVTDENLTEIAMSESNIGE